MSKFLSKKPIERNKMTTVKSMANKINIALFEEFGSIRGELPMLCSCCGKVTNIDNSFSSKGENLICRDCVNSHFEGICDAFDKYIFK